MENLPKVAGIFCLVIGIFFAKAQVKRYLNRKPGGPSWNFRLLLYGIAFIIAGVLLILRRI